MTVRRLRIVWWVAVGAAVFAATFVARAVSRQRSARFYPDARVVVDRRCIQCHSDHNTVPAFPIAGGGVRLDTAEQMRRSAERILLRAVTQRSMPLLNVTGITDDERASLARWIESGAAVPPPDPRSPAPPPPP